MEMRQSITLRKDLHKELKKLCIEKDSKLYDLVDEIIEEYVFTVDE